MDAENTHQVFDWLWSSGQLSARDIAALPALGVETVINLALPSSSNALAGEAELVTAQGIAYVQIPVLWEQPQLHQLTQFFGAMSTFKDRRVWVHCAKNMRVSAFIYLYRRICMNQKDEAALHPMREVWVPNPVWRAFIDDALTAYAAASQEG
jgi:protein tyrosine phosphatase (PTP) superfamily phosphohydrolase (DUF442 family)